MKKVIAGLSIVAASSLMAANINLYGQAHLSADSVNNGNHTTAVLASNASRLGVKADAEITDGITAVLQYEMGVDLSGEGSNDDGNGGNFNATAGQGVNNGFFTSARDSFVGVKGNFGTVLAGNLPVINQYMYDYNLFADQVGDLGNLWGGASAIGIDRGSNTIAYFIPSFVEGLSGDVAYVSDSSGANDGNKTTGVLLKANYAISGLKVGVAYIALTNDTVVTGRKPTDLAFTASYTMDQFSIGGGYLMSDNDQATNNKTNSYTVGGSFTMDKATVKAQYTAVNADAANSNANQIAVGADYAISKDATVYLAYASVSNDAGVQYGPNGWGHGKSAYGKPVLGQDPSVFSLGFVYKFGGNIYSK